MGLPLIHSHPYPCGFDPRPTTRVLTRANIPYAAAAGIAGEETAVKPRKSDDDLQGLVQLRSTRSRNTRSRACRWCRRRLARLGAHVRRATEKYRAEKCEGGARLTTADIKGCGCVAERSASKIFAQCGICGPMSWVSKEIRGE